jgi:PKD repeat protein
MNRKLIVSIPVFAVALGAAWLAKAGAAPTVTFEIDPPNPVAGQAIVLRDTSPVASSSWLWSFGDGGSSTSASPSHVWASPGTYTVELTAQGTTVDQTVTITPSTTIRMLAIHPFDVMIAATDPTSGAASPGQAVSVTDRFGWFSFPGITNDPGNPEVTVKLLEAPTFGHYWVFWSAMTSLQYTMTVTDVTTGQVQVYAKTDSAPSGGWDLTSFPYVTPPSTTPTATPAPGETPPPTPTRTLRTATASATAIAAPTTTPTPTPTPTPSGPTQLTLRVISWQWDWCPSADQGFLPCTPGNCAYQIDPDQDVHGVITLHQGCSYQVTLYNGDSGEFAPFHQLDAHPSIGISSPITIPMGAILAPITLTMPNVTQDVGFSCLNTSCGTSQQHEGMLGEIHIVP